MAILLLAYTWEANKNKTSESITGGHERLRVQLRRDNVRRRRFVLLLQPPSSSLPPPASSLLRQIWCHAHDERSARTDQSVASQCSRSFCSNNALPKSEPEVQRSGACIGLGVFADPICERSIGYVGCKQPEYCDDALANRGGSTIQDLLLRISHIPGSIVDRHEQSRPFRRCRSEDHSRLARKPVIWRAFSQISQSRAVQVARSKVGDAFCSNLPTLNTPSNRNNHDTFYFLDNTRDRWGRTSVWPSCR